MKMPYKDYKKQKKKTIERYYKNRTKRIKYQKEWDKNNKEKKKKYDHKRRENPIQKLKELIHKYSLRNHKPTLLIRYEKCQMCGTKENLEIHHLKYTENIEDCRLVCMPCHKKLHRKIA